MGDNQSDNADYARNGVNLNPSPTPSQSRKPFGQEMRKFSSLVTGPRVTGDSMSYDLFAVAHDGSAWKLASDGSRWERLPYLPAKPRNTPHPSSSPTTGTL